MIDRRLVQDFQVIPPPYESYLWAFYQMDTCKMFHLTCTVVNNMYCANTTYGRLCMLAGSGVNSLHENRATVIIQCSFRVLTHQGAGTDVTVYSLPVVPGQVFRPVTKQTLECSIQANQHRQQFGSLRWALLTSPMQGGLHGPG